MKLELGKPDPLGATLTETGVNFALFSENAWCVELHLFDRPLAEKETHTFSLTRDPNGIWYGHVVGAKAGQLYGYRVSGLCEPTMRHRFNPNKLLLDPYTRVIAGKIAWDDRLLSYVVGDPAGDASLELRNSAGCLPKCMVVDGSFDWGDDRAPRTPWRDTVIYECHVKGLTMLHPEVPPTLRGTYRGLASPAIIDHLKSLGVTAVELLPVQHAITRRGLALHGLTDYWGYNTIGFFAPDPRFATGAQGQQVVEFKEMVKSLHAAGIEVILDVVYNHSGEGDEFGPTISLRGIDNAAYYRLRSGDPRRYENHAGCGNVLNVTHPRVLQLIMDSLRYWVTEMHVDGFRFDLSTTLARDRNGVDAEGRFYAMLLQDPVLSQVKLIAEPWDIGDGGYRVGTLPAGFVEWNDKYRDDVRRFWLGCEGQIGGFARRLAGSDDLFGSPVRGPLAGLNFISCHDGFTLRDLVSYNEKHNEANGENNRDGHNENLSCNWGAEGPTSDEVVNELRERMQKNFLLTLACSLGVPMFQAGDEFGRSQRGNNNAYCHDNELTWVPWDTESVQTESLRFAREALAIRRKIAAFRSDRFYKDAESESPSSFDAAWLKEDGSEMTMDDWYDSHRRVIGLLVGTPRSDSSSKSQSESGAVRHLLVANSGEHSVDFQLPMNGRRAWKVLLNTIKVAASSDPVYRFVQVAGRSSLLLEWNASC